MIEEFYKHGRDKSSGEQARFAIVIETSEPRSPHDALRISRRDGLSPVLVALTAGKAYHTARGLALKLDAPIIMPQSIRDFRRVAGRCAFSVCDGINGAILSLLSYTPAYLDASSGPARELITIAGMAASERPVILPFDKRKSEKIIKVGARDSDFIYTYKRLDEFIRYEFCGSDNPVILYPLSEAFQSQ